MPDSVESYDLLLRSFAACINRLPTLVSAALSNLGLAPEDQAKFEHLSASARAGALPEFEAQLLASYTRVDAALSSVRERARNRRGVFMDDFGHVQRADVKCDPVLMDEFELHIKSVAERPGMYVGTSSLRLVVQEILGFAGGFAALGCGYPLTGWREWISLRFLISDSAWHWSRILVHVYGDDKATIAALPSLFREFRRDISFRTADEISAELTSQLLAKYGHDWHAPEVTHTADPS